MRRNASLVWPTLAFAVPLVGYLMLTAVLRAFLFHPSRDEAAEVNRVGQRVHYATDDGVRIAAWWVPGRGEVRRTVVSFHGNAATASDLWAWADAIAGGGTNVLLAEYRGYGASDGEPSARGIERDAEAAIHYLLRERRVPIATLVVHGQSLGGAAAIAALAGPASGAAGGIVESTFTSLHDMARVVVGLPLTRLLPDAYALDSAARAPSVRVPILQFHGDADEVIPFQFGRRLAARFPRARFVAIPGGSHNLADPEMMRAIAAFLDEVVPPR